MIYFESWQAAWSMAGHGPYVWAAYAITFAVLGCLIVVPLRRAQQVRDGIRAEQRRRAVSENVTNGANNGTSNASET